MAAGELDSSSSAADHHVSDSERVSSGSTINFSLLVTSQLQAALESASARHLEAREKNWEVSPCAERVSDVQWADCSCCGRPESVGIINLGTHTLISTRVISSSSLGRVAAVTYGQSPYGQSPFEQVVPPAAVDSVPIHRINSSGVALPPPCSCIYVFLTGFDHTGDTADACAMPGIINSLPLTAIQLGDFTLPHEQQSRKQTHQFASTFECLGWQKTQPSESSLKLAACSSLPEMPGCCSCIVSVWSFALDASSSSGIRRISEDHFRLPVSSESCIRSIKGQDLIWCPYGMLAVGTELSGPSVRDGCVFLFGTQVDSSGALQLAPFSKVHQIPSHSPIRCLALIENNILLCGLVAEDSALNFKWKPTATLFAFKIGENGLEQVNDVVLPASETLSLESAPATVWSVTVEQMIPFEIGSNAYIAVSVAIRHDPMIRFGRSRRFVGDICVFQVGRTQQGSLVQMVRVGEVPLLHETGRPYRVSSLALEHDRLSASPAPGEIGWLAYSSVFLQRRGQRVGRCDIWTMRLASSSAFELKHQNALCSASPLHSIALLEPPSSSRQLFVLGRFDFSSKQTVGSTDRLRMMRSNLLCWVDLACSSPRPLSVFDCAVQCSQDATVTFEDFLEQVTQQPGEQVAPSQSPRYMASCRVAIRASTELAHDTVNCSRGQFISEYLFKNDLANSAQSVRSCIQIFCEKLFFPFPFKEGRSNGRQKAEQKSTAHMLRFYPSVEHGIRKCNIVPLSGYSEFHGAWCILATTIVRMKNEINLEKLKENKGKLKETKNCAACQVTRQGGSVCKLNQKNASEETLRPLCLLNCHCENNCINHPTSICAQNFLLHLVTSNFPSLLQSKISRECQLPLLFRSTGVSSGSNVSAAASASADNESSTGPFTSASVSNDDDDLHSESDVVVVFDSSPNPRGSPPIVYSDRFFANDDGGIDGVDTSHLTPRTPQLDEAHEVARQFENE